MVLGKARRAEHGYARADEVEGAEPADEFQADLRGAPEFESAALRASEEAALGAPVEAPIDVSGDALLDTRRLCRAMAVALREERFPARWRDLV